MRKILFALAALAFMASPVRALVDTYTPNYHWILPYHLSPNWGAKLNTDLIAIDTTVALTIKQGIASLTIGSGTFTSSGANQYSILASSGVKILGGGYAFPDGTVLYSTSGISSSSVAPVGMLPSTQTWSGSNTYTQGVTFSSGVVLTSATAHSITADTESITNASIQHLIIPSGGTFAYTDYSNRNLACNSAIAIAACSTGERVNYGGCACAAGFVIISVPTGNTGNSCSAPLTVPATKSATAWACLCSAPPAYAYVFCVQ